MVMRFVIALAALGGLAGCLGKPALPIGGDDGGVDAPGDGPRCPAGMTPFPGQLTVRRVTELGRYDDDATDDLWVWGRVDNGAGAAAAYLILGREPMNLECYDRAFSFSGATLEPLDVWSGDLTGDSHSDLLLVARDDGPAANYQVHFYPGLATGGVEPGPQIQTASKNMFGDLIGRSLTDPLPVYIAGWTSTAADGDEVLFGGLDEPLAGFPFTAANTSLQPPLEVRNQDTTTPGPLGLAGSIQEVVIHTPPDPEQVIAFTSERVYVLAHVARTAATTHYQQLGSAALTDNINRFVRYHKRPFGSGETLAVTQNASGLDVVRVGGSTTPSVLPFTAPDVIGPSTSMQDLAFGDTDGSGTIDLVALISNNTSAQLLVYRNLAFAAGVTSLAPIRTTLPLGTNILAVGDFDGTPATPDHILALSTTVGTRLGRCFQVLDGQACLAECGTTTCAP